MLRRLIAVVLLFAVGPGVLAEPPTLQRVTASAGVPAAARGVCVESVKLLSRLMLPIPGLGFVPVPVELWECQVEHAPPFAPAGAPQVRNTVRLFTLGD